MKEDKIYSYADKLIANFDIRSGEGASTITRTTGSVPDWRRRILPSSPRLSVTFATSAWTASSSWAAFLSFTRTFFNTWG